MIRGAVVLGSTLALLLAGTGMATAPAGTRPAPAAEAQDAVVIAVLDSWPMPYHWDYSAAKMPQHLDDDRSNDLPLGQAPHEWLTGFPSPSKFDSYQPLKLSLEDDDPNAVVTALAAKDKAALEQFKVSTPEELNYHWIPGTKIIGAIDFSDAPPTELDPQSHGHGVSSVSVGNLHGTCPECLLVFIRHGGKATGGAAIDWAMSQPWIDVITNSYGFHTLPPIEQAGFQPRDQVYNGGGVENQRDATLRGQTVFWSAGNGFENGFATPHSTYFSSQKGPDWIVTVGAVSPGEENAYGGNSAGSANSSYSGAGKPVDVAGIGEDYPSAYGAITVSATGRSGFSGTSNATPTVAGIYARALYLARKDLGGPSRIQRSGVIATGQRYRCGKERPDCELGDGKLTATELRQRLLLGALHTPNGVNAGGYGPAAPPIGEDEFLNEGHGSYFAREAGEGDAWLEEFDRVLGPLEGRAAPLERPAGEAEWFVVDSFCRQHIWGAWTGGYYLDGDTELPGSDPLWPVRSSIEESCPTFSAPPPPPQAL